MKNKSNTVLMFIILHHFVQHLSLKFSVRSPQLVLFFRLAINSCLGKNILNNPHPPPRKKRASYEIGCCILYLEDLSPLNYIIKNLSLSQDFFSPPKIAHCFLAAKETLHKFLSLTLEILKSLILRLLMVQNILLSLCGNGPVLKIADFGMSR